MDDAFGPLLKCYLPLNRVVDGLVFVAAESYLRGQDELVEIYLKQALENDHHMGAAELRRAIENDEGEKVGPDDGRAKRLREVRDRHDLSIPI